MLHTYAPYVLHVVYTHVHTLPYIRVCTLCVRSFRVNTIHIYDSRILHTFTVATGRMSPRSSPQGLRTLLVDTSDVRRSMWNGEPPHESVVRQYELIHIIRKAQNLLEVK